MEDRRRVRTPAECLSGAGCWRGTHLGARAMGFNVLQGLWGQPGWLVQGADELLLRLPGGEGHTCRTSKASAPGR